MQTVALRQFTNERMHKCCSSVAAMPYVHVCKRFTHTHVHKRTLLPTNDTLCFSEKRACTYKHCNLQATMFVHVCYALQRERVPYYTQTNTRRRRLCEVETRMYEHTPMECFHTGRLCMS